MGRGGSAGGAASLQSESGKYLSSVRSGMTRRCRPSGAGGKYEDGFYKDAAPDGAPRIASIPPVEWAAQRLWRGRGGEPERRDATCRARPRRTAEDSKAIYKEAEKKTPGEFTGLVQPTVALRLRALTPSSCSRSSRAPLNATLGVRRRCARLLHFFCNSAACAKSRAL